MTLRSLVRHPLALLHARPRSRFAIGVTVLAISAIVVGLLVSKPAIMTLLQSGSTITAEFDRDYLLREDETKVEVAGLEQGVVSDVEYTDKGTVLVSMKVDDSAVDALGSTPSAAIISNTVLGGKYAVELRHGGRPGSFDGGFIPRQRTGTPIELDRILEALPSPTRQSLRNVVRQTEATLANSKRPLRDLLAAAPATLGPAKSVLVAAQGTRPSDDLPQLVTHLNAAARTVTQRQGQLGSIVRSLHDTTAVLADRSEPLAAGIEALPTTLRNTRGAMARLDGTLDELRSTATSLRPAARELAPLLRDVRPVLAQARPLMADLRPLLADARPTVRQLVPVARRGTATLAPLRAGVLSRLNGPISDTVLNTWHGTGPYKYSGGGMQAGNKFYEELGYLVTNLDRASMTQDSQGSMLNFQVGVNTRSLGGLPLTLPSLLKQMNKIAGGTR